MKLTVLLATVSIACAGIASAAPLCTDVGVGGIATMADYVALGSVASNGGCIIGDKLFSDFFYIGTASGSGIAATAAQVTMTPIGVDTYNPGILFSSNAWFIPPTTEGAGSFVDATIGFLVTVLPGGHLIDDASLTLTSSAFTGTGRANIGETLSPGGGQGTFHLDVDTSGALIAHQFFRPTNTVSVFKDLIMTAPPPAVGLGSAQVFSFAENFSEIPEPVGAVLIGSGLLALGLWRRRVSRG